MHLNSDFYIKSSSSNNKKKNQSLIPSNENCGILCVLRVHDRSIRLLVTSLVLNFASMKLKHIYYSCNMGPGGFFFSFTDLGMSTGEAVLSICSG